MKYNNLIVIKLSCVLAVLGYAIIKIVDNRQYLRMVKTNTIQNLNVDPKYSLIKEPMQYIFNTGLINWIIITTMSVISIIYLYFNINIKKTTLVLIPVYILTIVIPIFINIMNVLIKDADILIKSNKKPFNKKYFTDPTNIWYFSVSIVLFISIIICYVFLFSFK